MGGGGSWLLAQPQSNVHPPPSACLSLADSPAMTFSAFFACISFHLPFFPLPPLRGSSWAMSSGPLKALMLLCGSLELWFIQDREGFREHPQQSPPPQTTADGQELPDNGGKPGFRQTGILTLNPSPAGQALNFSEPQFPPGLHRDTRACPQIYSHEEASGKFFVGVDTFSICLFFLLGAPNPPAFLGSLHPTPQWPDAGPISCFSPGLVLLSLSIEDLLNSMEKTVP